MGDRATCDGSLSDFLTAYPDIAGVVQTHLSFADRTKLALTSSRLRKIFRPKILLCTETPEGGSLITYDFIGMNELLPKVDVFADLYENNPTYRAFSKIVGRNKLLSPRNRRCGFDIVRHAPPPNLLLEWQQDVHMQVRNAPQTNDFSVTHSPHKRWIAEAESIACPRPPPFDFNDPEFRIIDADTLTRVDLVFSDFMLGTWEEVNLLENHAGQNPEMCEDSLELPDLEILLMRKHRKFWIHHKRYGFTALLPDILDHADLADPNDPQGINLTSKTCFEYSTCHGGRLWVVGMPGQKISRAPSPHNVGQPRAVPLYYFPIGDYVREIVNIHKTDGGTIDWLNRWYIDRLKHACQWARSALRGISPLYIRRPHLFVSLENSLHAVQRVAFVHLIQTYNNGPCLLRDDFRWCRAQHRVGFPRASSYSSSREKWRRYSTTVSHKEDAMLIFTMPAKVKCRLICLRTGEASREIRLPSQIGKGALLVPPLRVS